MLKFVVFVAVLAVGTLGRILPGQDPMELIAQTYCAATHAEDKVPDVKEAITKFAGCIKGLIDIDTARTEFAEATRDKSYEGFFKNICTKAPPLKSCIRSLVPGVSPCVPSTALRYIEATVYKLLEFACNNEGAKLTSFFKEDGVQCIQEKNFAIADCLNDIKLNATVILNRHGGDIAGASEVTDEERCTSDNLGLLCIEKVMRGCSNTTPADLVDELRRTIATCNKNDTPSETTTAWPEGVDINSLMLALQN